MQELDRPGKRCYYASGKRDFALPKKVTHAPQETQECFLRAYCPTLCDRTEMLYVTSLTKNQPQLDHPFGIEIKGTVQMAFHLGHPRILPKVRVGINQGEN